MSFVGVVILAMNMLFNLTILENSSVVSVLLLLLCKISIEGHRQKDLAIMYRLLKMYQKPAACRFIAASKQCSSKPLTRTFKYF